MLKQGNSQVGTCIYNLFSMREGEVLIDQCRGLRADLQDMPATTAYSLLQASAYRTAVKYEPRNTAFSGLTLGADANIEPDFTLIANVQ